MHGAAGIFLWVCDEAARECAVPLGCVSCFVNRRFTKGAWRCACGRGASGGQGLTPPLNLRKGHRPLTRSTLARSLGVRELFRESKIHERRVGVCACGRGASGGQGLTPPLDLRKGHRPLTRFRWRVPLGVSELFRESEGFTKGAWGLRLRARGLRRPGANAAPGPAQGVSPLDPFYAGAFPCCLTCARGLRCRSATGRS